MTARSMVLSERRSTMTLPKWGRSSPMGTKRAARRASASLGLLCARAARASSAWRETPRAWSRVSRGSGHAPFYGRTPAGKKTSIGTSARPLRRRPVERLADVDPRRERKLATRRSAEVWAVRSATLWAIGWWSARTSARRASTERTCAQAAGRLAKKVYCASQLMRATASRASAGSPGVSAKGTADAARRNGAAWAAFSASRPSRS